MSLQLLTSSEIKLQESELLILLPYHQAPCEWQESELMFHICCQEVFPPPLFLFFNNNIIRSFIFQNSYQNSVENFVNFFESALFKNYYLLYSATIGTEILNNPVSFIKLDMLKKINIVFPFYGWENRVQRCEVSWLWCGNQWHL